jgi:hypothetical protein
MARDQFYQDVRVAVMFMAPRVDADMTFTDAGYIEKKLQGTDIWLARGVVAGFDPDDFSDLDDETQAVNDFSAAADIIASTVPLTIQQRNAALQPFTQIVQIVQGLVLEDWIQAAKKLLDEAEGLAKSIDWPCKRYTKEITEDFIGTYRLDRLVFAVEGVQMALVPVGRFAPGTDGMFELAVLPAYIFHGYS